MAAAWLLPLPLISLGCGVLMARLVPLPRRLRRTSKALLGIATTLAVALSGLQLWAHLMIDRSAAARAVAWLGADVDDIHRFPARPVPAGDAVLPLIPAAPPVRALSQVDLPDGSRIDTTRLARDSQTEALIVLRGDRILYETYANGGALDRLHTSFSVAKSFLSTLVGVALQRGDLHTLDDPVTRYVPELLQRDPRFARITLRHLITMSSGIQYSEHGLPWSDDASTYYSPDLRATALSARIAEPPGQRWHYNNYNPLLMGMVLERATHQPLTRYLSDHLWQPMGAEADASWSLDSRARGFEKMESGLNARPRDFARFGYLIAHHGRIGHRQVLPAQWIHEATARDTSHDPAEHYQYWWWVDTQRPGRFSAQGNKGQFIYIDPATKVVVVRLGRDLGPVMWQPILRNLADRAAAPTAP